MINHIVKRKQIGRQASHPHRQHHPRLSQFGSRTNSRSCSIVLINLQCFLFHLH
jgi:hypothetical protein